jgi:Transglutaminase-like superfamily/Coenzyme PQQ synthesis protein D (PqqD)
MLSLQAAEHVRHQSEDHGGVVILDTTAGMWMALNPTAGHFWRSWQSGAGFEEGVAEVAARYPEVPLESIRADAEDLVRDLCSRGLIQAVPPGILASAAADMAEDPAGGPRPARHLVIAAILALVAASIFLRLSFSTSFRLVRMSRGSWCRRAASPRQAADAVAAVSRAARWYPGRAACLEQSLAAVLVTAVRRRRLDWCLGSIPDPYRFHAWVEVAGQPVPTPQVGYSRILAV